MAFPKYESYKDSGVDWLGEIPSHWDVLPFKALFRMSFEKNEKNIVGEMLSVSGYRGIEIKYYEHEEQKRSAKELFDYRVVRKGQLVVNTMWLNYAGLGVSDLEGYVSPAYRSYWISEKLYGRFAHYLLRSHIYVQAYTGQMQGIRPNSLQIKNCDFNKFPVLVPKFEEQKRIAAFLDCKTAEIDEAIAKKQRLIELLQEQKAILINQAVTKGLNPKVPMRDSGVEWIGEIPEHWKLVQNRRFLKKLEQGSSPAITNSVEDENFFVLKLSAIKRGNYIDGEEKVIPQKDFGSSYQVKKGDLLMTRGNTPDLVADIGYVDIKITKNVMISDLIYRLTYNQKILLHEFMGYFLQSAIARYQIKICARGSSHTMVKVSQDHIRSWLVLIPPLDEQKEIISYLSSKADEFKFLEDKANQEIEKMNELKAIFIAQAVTGKIKV